MSKRPSLRLYFQFCHYKAANCVLPLSISVSSSLKPVSGSAWSLFSHWVLPSEDFFPSQSSQWHVVQQCLSLKANSQVWQTVLWLSYAFPCATMFTRTFMYFVYLSCVWVFMHLHGCWSKHTSIHSYIFCGMCVYI